MNPMNPTAPTHRHLIPVTYGAWPAERGALLRTFSRMVAYVPGATRVRFVRGVVRG